ncbi:hypothetical protein BVAVS116_H0061 (plasmid) [Borreliella valaisiana VS116]|uniref:Uncharacterized protein n=1 Tax=Borreliella valaisiana VS116 TaxID=445987 RepID=C0R9B8_BORVA|nr:hypothetical protein BVAVS116_H0061 [Borreliella valaisiana VS116]
MKGKNIHLNQFFFKEKQNKLREILSNTQKELEKKWIQYRTTENKCSKNICIL